MWGFLIGLYIALIIYPMAPTSGKQKLAWRKCDSITRPASMGCEEGSMDRQVAERSRTLG
jgi:hypothetical protein